MRLVSSLALSSALVLFVSFASADVQHVVGKGHTIEAISNRYHVPAKTIIEANHLKDVKRLRPGDVLTIPKAEAKKDEKRVDKKDAKAKVATKEPVSFVARPKTPGVVHLKRIASTEEADLRVTDGSGKVAAATLKSIEKLMRSQAGAAHPIEPRLVALLGVVSNHFGSRKIEIVSGFRPYSPTQYTAHSNHNHGKAIDFRVVGVPNEAVRDFCRTLRNTGCGYYPNSTFVHMDARESPAFWIDYSKPGEPPRYNAPNVDADEGTSDVQGDPHPAANTAPEAPAPAPAPAATESDPPPATKPSDAQ
jgi:uncharacterized protein YcbK (DUF882 family)